MTELEGKLRTALEQIEAILNRRPNAFVNDTAETQKMRGIIESALREVSTAWPQEILTTRPLMKDLPRH